MSGPEFITMGCRLNFAESEAMRALAGGQEDLVIVNSCAVTNEAVRQTRQAIRRAKRARPEARVIVTGCAAQIEPHTFAAMPEVERVVGNREKFEPASFQPPLPAGEGWGEGLRSKRTTADAVPPHPTLPPWRRALDAEIHVSDIMAVRETAPHLVTGFAERSRAFVEVQNGCDHRCTFCIIPYGRGNSRSVPAGLVVDRIKALVDEGFAEVVLTGVDVTSYGPDLPGSPSLGQLVERILKHVPGLQRLRLSSLDSVEIDERLEEIITGEQRFMPHLHMSFQAGDDMILKRMKRRHSRAQAIETVQRLKSKRPQIAIGADLIAGFPTETEEMAENSLKLIDECDIVMAHIFPFSPKQGTPAARMPQVPHAQIKERARKLREASAGRRAMWLQSLVGTRQRVLIEKNGLGHAENFAPVRLLRSSRAKSRGAGTESEARPSTTLGTSDIGNVVDVVITGADDEMLIGEAA